MWFLPHVISTLNNKHTSNAIIFAASTFKLLLVSDHGGVATSSSHVAAMLWWKSCSDTPLFSQFDCIIVDLFVLIDLELSTHINSVLHSNLHHPIGRYFDTHTLSVSKLLLHWVLYRCTESCTDYITRPRKLIFVTHMHCTDQGWQGVVFARSGFWV